MSERRRPDYNDLRCAILLLGRMSDFHAPECESGDWASSTAVEVLVDAGLIDATFYHGGLRLTDDGEGVYQLLVIGKESATLRSLVAD